MKKSEDGFPKDTGLSFRDIKKAFQQIKKKRPKADGFHAWIPVNGKIKHYGPGSTDQIERQIMEDMKDGEQFGG